MIKDKGCICPESWWQGAPVQAQATRPLQAHTPALQPNESFCGDAQAASGLRTGLISSGGTRGAHAWSHDKGHGQKGEVVLVQFALS